MAEKVRAGEAVFQRGLKMENGRWRFPSSILNSPSSLLFIGVICG